MTKNSGGHWYNSLTGELSPYQTTKTGENMSIIDDPAAPYEKKDEEEEAYNDDCRKPCDPDYGCPNCADYWQRMVNEGLWDMDRHRWTDRGWKEILK